MMVAIIIAVHMDIFTGEDMIIAIILTGDISERFAIIKENTMIGDITEEKNTADANCHFI